MRKIGLCFILFICLSPASKANKTEQTANVVDAIQSLNSRRGIYPSETSTCQHCLRPEDAYYSCYREICSLSAIPISADEYRDRLYESTPIADIKNVVNKYTEILKPLVTSKLAEGITQLEFISDAIEQSPQMLSTDPTAVHHFRKKIKTLKKLAQKEDAITPLIEMCGIRFAADYFGLPTRQQMNLYKENVRRSKNNVLNNIKPYFSSSSYETLAKNLQQTLFKFPPTQDEAFITLKQLVADELLKPKNPATIRPFDINQSHLKKTVSKNRKINSTDQLSSFFFQEFLNLNCDDFRFKTLADSTDGENINLGWAGIQNPEAGKAVLYHEIGHIISSYFYRGLLSQESIRKFNSINQCLANQNPSGKKISVDYVDEKQIKTAGLVSKFTEEDFADVVTAIVGAQDNLNVGCFLFDTFNPGQQSMLTWSSNYDRVHSTSFYRLLHIQYIQNGMLPEKCLEYIDRVGERKSFKNCWQSATSETAK